jgi:hypothetical protein
MVLKAVFTGLRVSGLVAANRRITLILEQLQTAISILNIKVVELTKADYGESKG